MDPTAVIWGDDNFLFVNEAAIEPLGGRQAHPFGSLAWTLSRAVPLLAEDRSIQQWIGAARDVSDRHPRS